MFDINKPEWSLITVDIPEGDFRITIHSTGYKDVVRPFYAALDEIIFTDGKCAPEEQGQFKLNTLVSL